MFDNIEIPETCFLCKQPCAVEMAFPSMTYRCEGCGIYNIAWTTVIENSNEPLPNAHLISGYTRECSDAGELQTLDEEKLEEIPRAAQVPKKIAEKAGCLLKYLCKKSESPGVEVAIDMNTDSAVAYAKDKDELWFLIETLINQEQIVDTVTSPLMVQVTPEGWAWYEDQ